MAELYFKVKADYDEVVRLRDEIESLKEQLLSTEKVLDGVQTQHLSDQLASAKSRMAELVDAAAKTGAELDSTLKNGFKDIDLTKPVEQLKLFDEQLLKMCDNLNVYFDGLKGKLQDMAGVLDTGKTITGNTPVNSDNSAQIESLKSQNADLTEQIRQQTQEIEQQQAKWQALADSVKTNNVQAVQQLSQATDEASKRMQMDEAKGSLRQVSSEMDGLAQELEQAQEDAGILRDKLATMKASGADASEMAEVEGSYKAQLEYVEKIKGQYNELATFQKDYNEQLREAAGHHLTIRTRIREAREGLVQMIDSGRMGTTEFRDAAMQAGLLRREMTLANAAMNYYANPARHLAAMKSAFQGAAGAASLVTGVMGIFNAKSEKMVQIQTKVQSYLAVVIGLETTYNAVKKSGMAYQMAYELHTLALAKARQLEASSTVAATIAQRAFNLVAKANPYVLLVGLILSVVGAVWALTKVFGKSKDAEDDATKAAREHAAVMSQMHTEWAQDVASSVSKQIVSYKELQRKWGELGNNLTAKKKFIDANQNAFHDLGYSINNVSQAESFLVKNTSSVVNALIARAEASAYQSVAEKAIEKRINADYKLKSGKHKVYKAGQKYTYGDIKTLEDTYGVNLEGDGYTSNLDYKGDAISGRKLTASGAAKLNAAVIKSVKNKLKNGFKNNAKEQDDFLNSISSGMAVSQAKVNAANKKIGVPTYSDSKKTKEKKDNSDKEIKEQESAQKKLNDIMAALTNENNQNEAKQEENENKKKLKQIDADYTERETKIKKYQTELAKLNKDAKVKDLNKNGLTSDQQQAIDKANKLNLDKKNKSLDDESRAELQSMQDYLKEYGTYQQQKLAITEEYEEKIRKAREAGNEWQAKSLEKERNKAVQQVEVNAIKQDINWGSIFGDFSTMFRDQLQPTIDKLKTISQSSDFKSSSLEDKKTLYELIAKLENSSAVFDKDLFKNVADNLKTYQQAMRDYISAQKNEKTAITRYDEYVKNNSDSNGKFIGNEDIKNSLKKQMDDASEATASFGDNVTKATSDLQSSSERTKSVISNFMAGLQGLTSGSLQGAGGGLMKLDALFNDKNDNKIGDITEKVGSALLDGIEKLLGKDSKASKAIADALGGTGMAGEIISDALSILDLLKNGVGGIISDLSDLVYNAINGMLSDLLSGNIIMKPLKSSMNGMKNILNTLTFGGFGSLIGNRSNAKAVAETTEKLTKANEQLTNSVDKLKASIDKESGAQAIATAEKAEKAQEDINKNTLEILKTQMGYHGAHHSNSYNWDLNASDYASLNKTLATYAKDNNKTVSNVNSLASIFTLSPEEMNYIRTYNLEMWEKMISEGDYDKSDYWEKYADLAGQLQEITDDLKETLTQISFDNLYDSFVDTLMDMNSDAQTFADDFSKYMMQAMLKSQIDDMMKNDIKKWYDDWAEMSQNGKGSITDEQMTNLKDEWNNLVNQGLSIRNSIASATGYDQISSSSQSSTSGGYTTMSQETGQELNGRFTAVQVAAESSKNILTNLNVSVSQILANQSNAYSIADETRSYLVNSYIELQQINENTKAIIQPIKQIADDVAKVKKNTNNL